MNIILTFTALGRYHCDGMGAGFPLLIDAELRQQGCETCPAFAECRMSHWTTHETPITDIEALRKACQEMGLEFAQGIKARGIDDCGRAIELDADYVIKLKPFNMHSREWQIDVAVKRADDKYSLVTDWYGEEYKNGVAKQVGSKFGRVLQIYGVHKGTMAAQRAGYTVRRENRQNGEIKLHVTC